MEKNYFRINFKVNDSFGNGYEDFRVTELPKYLDTDTSDLVQIESDFTDEIEPTLKSGEYIEEFLSVEEISKEEYTKYT